jgi:DNA invertase Pin-like site-specific DNA recombinase
MNSKNPSDAFRPDKFTGRLIGYARISTRDQSLNMQLDALRRAGVPEDNLWYEVKSGVKTKRPRLELALTQAVRGDVFVVYKLDRVGRSMLDLIEKVEGLTERGIGFRSLTDGFDTTTPGGRLLFHVIGALAQFERDLVVERTRDGMAAARRRGSQIGALPKLTAKDEAKAERWLKAKVPAIEVARRLGVVRQTILNRPHLARFVPRRKRKPKD